MRSSQKDNFPVQNGQQKIYVNRQRLRCFVLLNFRKKALRFPNSSIQILRPKICGRAGWWIWFVAFDFLIL